MKGIFGDMFDFNHDGKMNPVESAVEFSFLNRLLKDTSETKSELELFRLNSDEQREVWEDTGFDSDEQMEALEDAGLDLDELEFMDPDERRETLEDAGLDPDEYDF